MTNHPLDFPDYAKDIKLNLQQVLTEEGAPGLTLTQIYAVALAIALLGGNRHLIGMIAEKSHNHLDDDFQRAIRSAVALMSMNNIYYRSIHLVNHAELNKLPAKLRMTVMANPGIPKVDFEILSLAISAVNGCGKCLTSHISSLERENLSLEGIQSVLRISSVVHAATQVQEMVAVDHLF